MHRIRLTTPHAVVLAAAFAAAGLFGGVAFAGGQQFSDVGPSHPFFDEIERFGGAGISGGYADGTYRPATPVSRAAMAAFMTRGLTSVGSSTETSSVLLSSASTIVNTVVFTVPGADGGAQHLVVDASATWTMDSATKADACSDADTEPCVFGIGIYHNGVLIQETFGRVTTGDDGGTLSVHALIPDVTSGINTNVTLRATRETNLQSGDVRILNRQLIVRSAPFIEGT